MKIQTAWVLLTLAGCGQPFSNRPLHVDVAQDQEIAQGLPEQHEFALSAPTEEDEAHPERSCADPEASKAACRSFRFAGGVTKLIREMMRPIRELSRVRPAVREAGRRVWGPTQAPEAHWQRVVARRLDGEDAGVAWASEVSKERAGPYEALLTGEPGALTYDGDVAAGIGKEHAGLMHITTAGEACDRSLGLQLAGFKGDGLTASDGEFRFTTGCDGAGRMDWGFLAPHPRRDCTLPQTVVARWDGTGAGRADIRNVGPECWDADFRRVPDNECVFPEAVQAEEITVPDGTCEPPPPRPGPGPPPPGRPPA